MPDDREDPRLAPAVFPDENGAIARSASACSPRVKRFHQAHQRIRRSAPEAGAASLLEKTSAPKISQTVTSENPRKPHLIASEGSLEMKPRAAVSVMPSNPTAPGGIGSRINATITAMNSPGRTALLESPAMRDAADTASQVDRGPRNLMDFGER